MGGWGVSGLPVWFGVSGWRVEASGFRLQGSTVEGLRIRDLRFEGLWPQFEGDPVEPFSTLRSLSNRLWIVCFALALLRKSNLTLTT